MTVRTVEGLIPAWAGKTARLTSRRPQPRAHPRVGGENSDWDTMDGRAGGSSPRGRGKRCAGWSGKPPGRLIPAWAGKTPDRSVDGGRAAAHPRVGGENTISLSGPSVTAGSSPRGRGKPRREHGCVDSDGLIPAWAGKTRAAGSLASGRGAHPRVGGENFCPDPSMSAESGSSPRGRGKPSVATLIQARRRLIPAWAGKTSPSPTT